jgi:signal peptidase I
MKINSYYKEEKPINKSMNNSTQSSALSTQSSNTQSSALSPQSSETQSSVLSPQHSNTLSPHYFEKICTELLSEGKSVRFEAPGKSMYPVILDGETLIVEPVAPPAVEIGDIILYKSEEKLIAHRVISIKKFTTRNTQPPALSPQPLVTQSSALSPQSSTTDSSAHSNQYSLILRGDASYSYDEPVYADQILGKVIAIERNGRSINPYSLKHKLSCWARIWRSRIKRILF